MIDSSADLAALCSRLAKSPYVAVDTEFMRENSYWPELCLIQIADEHEAAAIDPMAPGIDLKPLLDLMVDNEEVLKVFHAGGQDIEIVHNLTGKTPHPLFDTQVAAMAIGQGDQIGYSNLVDTWLGITLDKGARFTDWARRPLDKRQIDYAIGDVTHLVKIFPRILDKLKKLGRGAWLDEEMDRLADPANYENQPDDAWLRLKLPSRKADALGRLKVLAAWREREAQAKNLPRGRIVKDETLVDLAGSPPAAQADLGRVRGLSQAWSGNDIGGRLMKALAAAVPLPADEMPGREERRPGVGKDGALVADLLKLLLKIRAKEIAVAPRLLARTDELEQLACGQREGLSILDGWRGEQFGRDALALVEGRMAFAVRNGKLRMTRTEEERA
ncbi:ribonuclease D [Sphingomonas jejuensis]|uniref:Ribonuclease D n=1 Tax=Sphingomonas jejuensis TaxID=904715 RepID=A0ABX0XKU5_9SPHN|nr:ribonuclease D [Sphingomonas jejuensis]